MVLHISVLVWLSRWSNGGPARLYCGVAWLSYESRSHSYQSLSSILYIHSSICTVSANHIHVLISHYPRSSASIPVFVQWVRITFTFLSVTILDPLHPFRYLYSEYESHSHSYQSLSSIIYIHSSICTVSANHIHILTSHYPRSSTSDPFKYLYSECESHSYSYQSLSSILYIHSSICTVSTNHIHILISHYPRSSTSIPVFVQWVRITFKFLSVAILDPRSSTSIPVFVQWVRITFLSVAILDPLHPFQYLYNEYESHSNSYQLLSSILYIHSSIFTVSTNHIQIPISCYHRSSTSIPVFVQWVRITFTFLSVTILDPLHPFQYLYSECESHSHSYQLLSSILYIHSSICTVSTNHIHILISHYPRSSTSIPVFVQWVRITFTFLSVAILDPLHPFQFLYSEYESHSHSYQLLSSVLYIHSSIYTVSTNHIHILNSHYPRSSTSIPVFVQWVRITFTFLSVAILDPLHPFQYLYSEYESHSHSYQLLSSILYIHSSICTVSTNLHSNPYQSLSSILYIHSSICTVSTNHIHILISCYPRSSTSIPVFVQWVRITLKFLSVTILDPLHPFQYLYSECESHSNSYQLLSSILYIHSSICTVSTNHILISRYPRSSASIPVFVQWVRITFTFLSVAILDPLHPFQYSYSEYESRSHSYQLLSSILYIHSSICTVSTNLHSNPYQSLSSILYIQSSICTVSTNHIHILISCYPRSSTSIPVFVQWVRITLKFLSVTILDPLHPFQYLYSECESHSNSYQLLSSILYIHSSICTVSANHIHILISCYPRSSASIPVFVQWLRITFTFLSVTILDPLHPFQHLYSEYESRSHSYQLLSSIIYIHSSICTVSNNHILSRGLLAN